MSRIKKLRPSPALAVAVAAMVVAIAGVAVAGPVAHQSGGALNKKKVKNIARAIAAEEAAKTAVRTVGVAANGTVFSGSGITQANVTHPSAGNYCINGLTPALKDAVVTLDFAETGFKTQVFTTVGGGGGACAGKQLSIRTFNNSDAPVDARFHVLVAS
jgi:hypothetical protein